MHKAACSWTGALWGSVGCVLVLPSLPGLVCGGAGGCQQSMRVPGKLLCCYVSLPIVVMSPVMHELYPHSV